MKKIFILRDTQEIHGIFEDLEHAYNHILQILYIFCKNSILLNNKSCNMEIILNLYQITEYDGNMIENVYNLGSDFYLYDKVKKIYTCDKISVCDYITKLNKFIFDEFLVEEEDLNIFLPVNDETEYNKSICTKDLQEHKELEARMKMLAKIREEEIQKLNILKKSTTKDMELVTKENSIQTYIKRMDDRDLEALVAKKKKFLVDIKVFKTIDQEITDNKREIKDIPPLFVKEFNTFTKMKNNNIFKQSEDDMFEYFLSNFKKNDKGEVEGEGNCGKYTSIFDGPSFTEQKECARKCVEDFHYSDSSLYPSLNNSDSDSDEESDEHKQNITKLAKIMQTRAENMIK